MIQTADVLVIGGGAAGAACARELARSGRSVLVFDPDDAPGAAWRAAAGMLAAQVETTPSDPLFNFGLAGRERTVNLAHELRVETGIDIGVWREGIIQLAFTESAVTELRAQVGRQRQHGHMCDWLDAAEVAANWPWAGKSLGALWAPRDGAVDPQRLVEALRADAKLAGANFIGMRAERLVRERDGVKGVVAQGTRYTAGAVVLAAGAWTHALDGLPRPVSVEPVRGQMSAFPWPADTPRAIVYGDHGYVVHRNGEALVGTTMEVAGFDATTTDDGVAAMKRTAAQILPALANVAPTRTWAGLRPMTPDGLPILGAEPAAPGLWFATGHGRNGVLLAAISGHFLQLLMDGEQPDIDISAFSPTRFWRW